MIEVKLMLTEMRFCLYVSNLLPNGRQLNHRGMGFSIAKVRRDVPPVTVYFFVLLVRPRVHFFGNLSLGRGIRFGNTGQ